MSERAFDRDDVRLLFEVLFDIRSLLAEIARFIEGGEDDGWEEEEEEEDGPR